MSDEIREERNHLMMPEAKTEDIRDRAAQFQQRLNRFAEIVETVCRETDALPLLPRKQMAREAYRLQMLLAGEANTFLEEFYVVVKIPHFFDLITIPPQRS